MTTANQDIQSALGKHTNLMTPTMSIAWENTQFNPTLGTPFLRTWLLPQETKTTTLGTSGVYEYSGFYQIDCVYPKAKGWYSAKAKAGYICSHFKRNTTITYNNIRVKIWRSSPGPAIIDGEYYMIPVRIFYVCYDNVS